MTSKRDRIYPDTNTLYPISIADLILRLAEIGLISLAWTEYLLDEVERVLVDHKGLSGRAARYFCDCIRQTFPDGRLERASYEHLIDSRRGPDKDDHEHSAAVAAGNVDVVLTADRIGFPTTDIFPARSERPDDYLADLLETFPLELIQVVQDMAHSRHEPQPIGDTIEALRKAGLVKFAAAITAKL
jgi:PIN domain